jgi:DNA gyrase subunit A
MATTTKPGAEVPGSSTDHAGTAASAVPGAAAPASGEPEVIDVTVKGSLILSVTENGYGKRTPADEYRLTNRGGKGVINVKTTERVGKVVAIAQVDETSEVMLISHYGKIIRMDSTTIRESGRNAQGVRLLNMEPGDRVAAAVVIAPDTDPNITNGGTLIQ